MNRKLYLAPEINVVEIETMSIIAISNGLNEPATEGGFRNPRPGDGSIKKYAPSQTDLNPWKCDADYEQDF